MKHDTISHVIIMILLCWCQVKPQYLVCLDSAYIDSCLSCWCILCCKLVFCCIWDTPKSHNEWQFWIWCGIWLLCILWYSVILLVRNIYIVSCETMFHVHVFNAFSCYIYILYVYSDVKSRLHVYTYTTIYKVNNHTHIEKYS